MRTAQIPRHWTRLGWAALASWIVGGGCGVRAPLAQAGVTIAPPAIWRTAPLRSVVVPGTPLAAWHGPEGSSLAAYRTLPSPGGTADGLVVEVVNRLDNLPGLRITHRRVETLDGRPAARVEAVAPGTGAAWAPTGTGPPVAPPGQHLIPTHRVSVAIPRPGDTLWLVWHYPESARDAVAPQVDATLRSLRLHADPAPPY